MSCCNSNCNHDPCGSSFNQALTKAGQYAQYAQTQANKAEDLWHEFNALYLGSFASAPTVDNEGNPLQEGALYFNSVSNQMFVWQGGSWIDFDFDEFTPFLATGTPFARNLVTRFSDVVNVKDFGAVGDGVTDDTAAIQNAIDAVFANGGGEVFFPTGKYVVYSSGLFVLNVHKGVSLIGPEDRSAHIHSSNSNATVILMISPEFNKIANLEISSVSSVSGAGHGIIVGSTGTDYSCNNNTWINLYIHDVASYGLGLQSGSPVGCVIQNIITENTGADAIDLKARYANPLEPSGNSCSNILIKNHGMRVTGSAGIDVRGIWNISNVSVIDFGGEPLFDYYGIRFRTIPSDPGDYPGAGNRSTLSGAYIRPKIGAALNNSLGIFSGSWDVRIVNVLASNCNSGFAIGGNINGVPIRNILQGCTAIDAVYGFFIGADVEDTCLIGCSAVNCSNTGFRNEAIKTVFISCKTKSNSINKSSSTTALNTEIVNSCDFQNEIGPTQSSPALGRSGFSIVGNSSDIDFLLSPKGNGVLRFGTNIATSDAPITSYIAIKDSSGNTRKLAVIS